MRRYSSEHAESARSLQLVLLALKTAEENFHPPTALRKRKRFQCGAKFFLQRIGLTGCMNSPFCVIVSVVKYFLELAFICMCTCWAWPDSAYESVRILIIVDCTYNSAWLVDVRDSDELLSVVRKIYMQAWFSKDNFMDSEIHMIE